MTHILLDLGALCLLPIHLWFSSEQLRQDGTALLRPGVLAGSSLPWVLWARSMRKQSTGSLTRTGALLDWWRLGFRL